jgi:hypothetical protein
MEKRIDYRRLISLMSVEEFVRFCSILHIDLNKFGTRHNSVLKKEVGDLLSRAYHRLRNSPEEFGRLDRIVANAIFKVNFE